MPRAPLFAAALSGAAASAQSIPAGTTTHTLTHGGRTRTFIVNRAANVGTTSPAGLVFVFHGFGNTASWMNGAAAVSSTASSNGFIGVTPQGVSNSWNAGACCGTAAASRVDDVGFAREMVEYVASRQMVDRDRVFTTGYSNGGMMSYRLICEAADTFRGAGPVAGTYMYGGDFGSCAPAEPRPAVGLHGTADFVVPYNGANSAYIRYITGVQGCPTGSPTFVYGIPAYYNMQCYQRSNCAGSAPGASVWCIYNGMGHVWPNNGLLRIWNFLTTGRLGVAGETALEIETRNATELEEWAKSG